MTVAFTIQPPGGSEVALDNDLVLWRTARFTSAVNGAPGDFTIQVRDVGHDQSFVSGSIIRLTIDGVRKFGGFLLRVRRTWPLPVMPTDPPTKPVRYWELTGADWNILWRKRRIYDAADLTHIYKLYPLGSYDDDILNDILDHYTDIGDVCPTRSIARVGKAVLDIPGIMVGRGMPNGGAPWNAGDTLQTPFETIARATGGIYYIDPEAVVTYCDADTADASIGLSDTPGAGERGYRNLKLNYAGDQLCNDGMIWGAALGSDRIVFSRVEDAASIAAHGRWQKGIYSAALYHQASADLVASTMVYGTPESLRGAKDPKIIFECDVNGADLTAGQKVVCTSAVFGFTMTLPVRKITYSFAAPDFPVSHVYLSWETDATFEFREQLPPPVLPPPPVQPPVFLCGGFDDFQRADQSGFGRATAGPLWTDGGSTGGATAAIVSHEGILTLPLVIGGDGATAWQAVDTGYHQPWGYDLLLEVRASDVTDGADFAAWMSDGFGGANNWGFAGVFDPSGSISIGGVSFPVTWPSGNFWIRQGADFANMAVYAKVWADGDPEPATWTYSTGVAGLPVLPVPSVFNLYIHHGNGVPDSTLAVKLVQFSCAADFPAEAPPVPPIVPIQIVIDGDTTEEARATVPTGGLDEQWALHNAYQRGSTRVWRNGTLQRLGTDYLEWDWANGRIKILGYSDSRDTIIVSYLALYPMHARPV